MALSPEEHAEMIRTAAEVAHTASQTAKELAETVSRTAATLAAVNAQTAITIAGLDKKFDLFAVDQKRRCEDAEKQRNCHEHILRGPDGQMGVVGEVAIMKEKVGTLERGLDKLLMACWGLVVIVLGSVVGMVFMHLSEGKAQMAAQQSQISYVHREGPPVKLDDLNLVQPDSRN